MATFLLDGQTITVKSAEELISVMHASSRTPAADDKAYMMDVSDRTALQSGYRIRVDSPQAFVNDLVHCGLVKIVVDEIGVEK